MISGRVPHPPRFYEENCSHHFVGDIECGLVDAGLGGSAQRCQVAKPGFPKSGEAAAQGAEEVREGTAESAAQDGEERPEEYEISEVMRLIGGVIERKTRVARREGGARRKKQSASAARDWSPRFRDRRLCAALEGPVFFGELVKMKDSAHMQD
jgi:hypothetical protein